MNCSEWEREIASDVESDGLQDHLKVCPNCRAFAREIEENRAALQSLAVDGASLDAVRSGVLAEIRSQRGRSRRWTWFAAAAACLAIVCAPLVLTRFRNPAPPRAVEFAKTPHVESWTVSRPVRRAVRVRHNRPAMVAAKEPLVVKMLTNDPDVIIVWLIDQKGDAL
jgi:hypothetical protein